MLEKSEKEPNYHFVELAAKQGSEGVLTGANAELLIDGEPVKGCHRVIIELGAMGIAKVQIELYAKVRFSAIGDVTQLETPIDVRSALPLK